MSCISDKICASKSSSEYQDPKEATLNASQRANIAPTGSPLGRRTVYNAGKFGRPMPKTFNTCTIEDSNKPIHRDTKHPRDE